jgi:phosphodiesterase/alkaline phosphatase D-like protein
VPGTTYYYRVRSKDGDELEFTSQEYSFKAILKPKISNMRVKDVTPYSVTISWDTNVETETLINWGKTAAYGEKKGVSGVSKVHEVKVENLEDNQEYHYQILAKDEAGNEVSDEDKIVRTPLDTEGPKIENVKLDVLPMGEADATGQVIVSWNTNKPATTMVEYDEGVIGGKYSLSTVEDKSLNTSHTVIIKELKPATSYHYRIVSKDRRENVTVSQDFTFVTPTKEKSILQLIIKSLEETFSWTKNLIQFFGNIGRRFIGR